MIILFVGNTDIVFINFYADWCRFSNILAPTWDEAADLVQKAHPTEGKVILGKVDCDQESEYSSFYLYYMNFKLFFHYEMINLY